MRSSIKRKSRKNYFNAPIHIKAKQVSAHVNEEVKKELKTRSTKIKKGYRVKIMRGKFKGTEGKIIKVSHVNRAIYVEGVTRPNARGDDKPLKLHPSNVIIIALK